MLRINNNISLYIGNALTSIIMRQICNYLRSMSKCNKLQWSPAVISTTNNYSTNNSSTTIESYYNYLDLCTLTLNPYVVCTRQFLHQYRVDLTTNLELYCCENRKCKIDCKNGGKFSNYVNISFSNIFVDKKIRQKHKLIKKYIYKQLTFI